MSIRNFKPSIAGSKEFSLELKSNKSLLKFAEWAAESLHQSADDDLFFRVFQAHLRVGGKPVTPNTTLGYLTSLIDVGAVQETISASNLKNLLFGKTGLLTIFKLLKPGLLSRDIEGNPILAGSRHRTASMAIIGYTVALAMKRLGMDVNEAVKLVDAQQLYVEELEYDVMDGDSINLGTRLEKKGTKSILHLDELTPKDAEALQFLCTSQIIIQDNSSRKPQPGEIESVELSSVGVNPRSASSVINGFRNNAIDKFKLFRYLSSAELYDAGYSLLLKASLKEANYSTYFPGTMRKLLDSVSKSLWSHEEQGQEGNYPFRALMTGCENSIPVYVAKSNKYRSATPKAAAISSSAVLSFINRFWQVETMEAWYQLLDGYDFSRFETMLQTLSGKAEAAGEDFIVPELNLVELAFQLYHCSPGAETINLDKALTRSKDKVSFSTIFEGLLNQLDYNLHQQDSSLLEYFDVFDIEEEEEDDVAMDEELQEAEDFMSESLFDEEL